jgi:hypothetical protein
MKFQSPTVMFTLRTRINEHVAAGIVITLLQDWPGHSIQLRQLWRVLSQRVIFCPADREMSLSRTREPKWCMAFRNIKAHKDVRGNAIHDGLLIDIPGGFALGRGLKAPTLWDHARESHA